MTHLRIRKQYQENQLATIKVLLLNYYILPIALNFITVYETLRECKRLCPQAEVVLFAFDEARSLTEKKPEQRSIFSMIRTYLETISKRVLQ